MSEDIEEQLRQKEEELEALRQEFEEYQETARSVEVELEQELEKYIAQNFELEREAKGLRAKIKEMQESDRLKARNPLEELQKSLAKIKQDRDKLELRNEDLEDEVYRLKKGLVGAVSHTSGPSLEVEFELSELKRENEELKQRLASGSDTTGNYRVTILEAELGKTQLELAKAQAAEVEADYLRRRIEVMSEELADLKDNYDKALDEISLAKHQLAKGPARLPELELITQAIEEPSFTSDEMITDFKTEVSENYESKSAEEMLKDLLNFVSHNLIVYKHKTLG
mmetsp:Transcript_18531/g.33459  ORF Transcript_18531/g.33459 Transcript_18531/m.33459 type:complete len:284 (+) Transcript_18531:1996-2847(+)